MAGNSEALTIVAYKFLHQYIRPTTVDNMTVNGVGRSHYCKHMYADKFRAEGGRILLFRARQEKRFLKVITEAFYKICFFCPFLVLLLLLIIVGLIKLRCRRHFTLTVMLIGA